jgi:aminopeptidase N
MHCEFTLPTRRLSLRWIFAALAALTYVATIDSPVPAIEHAQICRYCRHLTADSDTATPLAIRRYAPDRQVDVRHIKLDITPDFDRETVSGTATLRFAPISEPLVLLRLDAVNLDVDGVRSSHKVRDWSGSSEKLTIVFDQAVPVGQDAWVEVDYSAEPVEGLYFRTPAKGLPKEDIHVWTQGEPHEARHWFPCFDYPNERSTSEVICHVPHDMTVVSNGKLIGEQDEKDGQLKSVHWRQDKPHVSYLICFVAGRLEKLEGKHGNTPLGFYSQPSKAKYAASAFADTADIMDFFEREIGLPFPWDKYDQCTIADFMWGGMENTTLTTLNQRTIHAPEVENVIIDHTRSLNAHEMAHQWFGNYVTCKDWSHLWLNEGFATYYAHLYAGARHGRDELLFGLYEDAKGAIFQPENLKNRQPIVDRIYEHPLEQFDFRNYPKASWVLHMLRSQLGAKLYREAIQTYLQRYALGAVETQNLQSVMEELSGRSLDKFFDQWLHHGGVPELKITYQWHAQDNLAQVTIEQTQQTGDDVLLFEFPTKLRFVVNGKTIDESIEVKKKQQDYFVRLPAEPAVVRFDPEYSVLALVDFALPDKMLLAQLKIDDDVIGRLLACDALAKRARKASVASLKEVVQGDAHHGVRRSAAAALAKIGTKESVEALIDSAKQSDARVRLAVVTELGTCYRDAARQKLAAIAATEKNPVIVAAAVTGLGKYQGDESREAISKALANNSFNHEPTAAAFAAIRDLGDAEFAPALMKTIKAREREIDAGALAEGMVTLAKISQRDRGQREAYDFLTGYLDHPREALKLGAIRALGELHDARARPLLERFRDGAIGSNMAPVVKAAISEIDKAAPLAPAEVSRLRSELRELRANYEKLQKSLDELKSKPPATENKSNAVGAAADGR